MSSFQSRHSLSLGNGVEGVEVEFEVILEEEVVKWPLCSSVVVVGPVFV